MMNDCFLCSCLAYPSEWPNNTAKYSTSSVIHSLTNQAFSTVVIGTFWKIILHWILQKQGEFVVWLQLIYDRFYQLAAVKILMEFRVPKIGEFIKQLSE
jgi:hypothetical protein